MFLWIMILKVGLRSIVFAFWLSGAGFIGF